MIFGVAGQKKHGKDTVAQHLVNKYGYEQRAFADHLKELCAILFHVPLNDLYDEVLKEVLFDKPIIIKLKHYMDLIATIKAEGYVLSIGTEYKIQDKMAQKHEFTSNRDLLQFIGTDILRDEVDADYHYNTVLKWFKNNQIKNGVVSDVRFPNERLNLERDFNSRTILVVRPSMQANATSSHASETSIGSETEYDYVVMNDSTLEDLYNKVDDIVQYNKE